MGPTVSSNKTEESNILDLQWKRVISQFTFYTKSVNSASGKNYLSILVRDAKGVNSATGKNHLAIFVRDTESKKSATGSPVHASSLLNRPEQPATCRFRQVAPLGATSIHVWRLLAEKYCATSKAQLVRTGQNNHQMANQML